MTTLCEQNPNLDQYRLNDSDWSILVDMNAYLYIWRRFHIEVDVESCESSSRLFGALKNLKGHLRLFQKRKPHMKPLSYVLYEIEGLIQDRLVELSSVYMIGKRFIAMQTTPGANFANSP